MNRAESPVQPATGPKVLVVMHDPLAPAGLVGLAIAGARGRTWVHVPHERYGSVRPDQPVDLPADHGRYDALVVLGGAMHAGDDAAYPHFSRLLDLIRRFHGAEKPVLGICLGAQLIGRAFGAAVRRRGFLEIGFEEVVLADAAGDDPLLAGLGPGFMAMQWHEDTVDLPAGAVRLASSQACANQIFRLGRTTYGFQGHIEVTPDIVRSWVRSKAPMLAEHHPAFFGRIERELMLHMKDAMDLCRRLTGRWLALTGRSGG